MRILQVVHRFPPLSKGGTEVQAYEIAKKLKTKYLVFVLYPLYDSNGKGYTLRKTGYEGLPVIQLIKKWPSSLESINYLVDVWLTYRDKRIKKVFESLLDQLKPDIIHFQHLFNLSVELVRSAKKKGIPTVVTLHDYWFLCHRIHLLKNDGSICRGPEKGEAPCFRCYFDVLWESLKGRWRPFRHGLLKVPLEKGLEWCFLSLFRHRIQSTLDALKLIDVIVSPSRFLKEKFEDYGVEENRILHVTHGINPSLFTGLKKSKSNNIRFGYAGAIVPHKGVHILLDAYCRVQNSKTELKIFGDYQSDISYYQSLKRDFGHCNVQFMGQYNDVRVPFCQIDLLIVPSICYETGPLVVQEAFMAKVPVIASRIGTMPEVVLDGKNGFLFRPNDRQELATKLKAVIEEPGLLRSFVKNIRPVKTIDEQVAEIEEIYLKIFRNGFSKGR